MKFSKKFLLILVLFSGTSADASCINPANYVHSTVVIGKNLSDGSAFGTAWFYKNQKTLITAGHVARIVASKDSWTKLEIQQEAGNVTSFSKGYARILKLGNIENATDLEIAALERYSKEDLAIVELGYPYLKARPLTLSPIHSHYYSLLWAIAYPAMKLSFAKGRLLPPGIERRIESDFPSMVHIEIEGNRQQLIGGSSGSPVLSCDGKVLAIVNSGLSDSYLSPTGEVMHRTTGTATNYALPSSFVEKLLLRE